MPTKLNAMLWSATLTVATLCADDARGQGYACPRARVVYYQPVAVQAPAQAPAVYYQAAPTQAQPAQPGGYAEALNVINAARMAAGRGPLRWSPTLAGYAATNTGVHAPGSSGGAGQCWAGVSDPVAAARMWLGSSSHLTILMRARFEIGISVCPTGVTGNAR
jgi:uncharacterized protein YkwD